MVALLVAATLALQVDLRADQTLPCAAHAALLEALRRRPGLRLGPGQAELEFQTGSWQLVLRRGSSVLLRRTLPLAGADCALVADTAALVIDRYFSQVRAPVRPPRPQRIAGPVVLAEARPAPAAMPPRQEASPPAEGEPDASARAVLIPSMAASMADYETPEPRRASDLLVSVGLAALDDLRPGLWLQAERRWRSGSASFLLVAGAGDHDYGPVGENALQTALVALSVGPCFERYVRACFAPFAGARGQAGGSRRSRTGAALRLEPELGAVVSVDRTVVSGLHVGLSLLLGRPLGEPAFDPAAPPQELDYAAALRAGFAF